MWKNGSSSVQKAHTYLCCCLADQNLETMTIEVLIHSKEKEVKVFKFDYSQASWTSLSTQPASSLIIFVVKYVQRINTSNLNFSKSVIFVVVLVNYYVIMILLKKKTVIPLLFSSVVACLHFLFRAIHNGVSIQ